MTTIHNTIRDASQRAVAGVAVVALYDQPFRDDGQDLVARTIATDPTTTGYWEIELEPGRYTVLQKPAKGDVDELRYFTVVEAAEPVWLFDILDETPGEVDAAEIASLRALIEAHEADTGMHAGNPAQVVHDGTPLVGDWLKVKTVDPLVVERADEPSGGGDHTDADHADAFDALGAAAAAQAAAAGYTDAEIAALNGTYALAADLDAEEVARDNADTAETNARTAADALLIPLTQKGAAGGVATLDGSSKIPTSQLPALAITDTHVVASQAAMLALTAETGDVAVRSDLNKSFILDGADPTVLANWQELLTPTDTVLSVNGEVGAVSLSAADVGADAAGTASTAVGAHSADTTGVHGITDTAALETTTGSQAKVDAHVNDATDAHDASAVSFTPAGSIAATNVQAAINELDTEKSGTGHTHSEPEVIGIACSDETTAITTGTAKATFRMPFAMTLTSVRATLTTASSSGTPTIDINEGGTTILSTKLTIDANEKTSTTAATPPVISDSSLADDAEITVDVDTAGTGATGLKVWLVGTRT